MPLTLPDQEASTPVSCHAAVRVALAKGGFGESRGTVVAGLIGRGIQESRTPRMHEAEGARLGLRYRYRLLDFDQMRLDDGALGELILATEESGFAGLNVTHPFKEIVVRNLQRLSPDAASIGAVNTIVLRGGSRIGHNTDCWGFTESFRRGMNGVALHRVVLIGAGGAGMAVAYALLKLGAFHLTIFDLNATKAVALAQRLASTFGADRVFAIGDLETEVRGARGVVNATPVGMAKYPGLPLSADWLRPDLWVADIVYFPQETPLLRAARALGCRTLSGIGMAVFQAVKAFELITGSSPDADEMARHFEAT